MKTSKENLNPHILLFWSVPSISKVHEYKIKSDLLNQAMMYLNQVQVVTNKNEILKFENVGIDSGRFFGLKKFRGDLKKVLLNINAIKTVILLWKMEPLKTNNYET